MSVLLIPTILTIVAMCLPIGAATSAASDGWSRRTIDAGPSGADGVRLGDADRDGLADVVVGWEEAGITRLYFNPGEDGIRHPWPYVELGPTPSVEDALIHDYDSDGRPDVVVSMEGDEKRLAVFSLIEGDEETTDRTDWRSETIDASHGLMQWMFAAPFPLPDAPGAVFAAGKGAGAAGGILAGERWLPVVPVGWVMSIIPVAGFDGIRTVLLTDRKGPRRGVWRLQYTADDAWHTERIAAAGREVMFADYADVDGDGLDDIAVALGGGEAGSVLLLISQDENGGRWDGVETWLPPWAGRGKAVSVGDVNLDGRPDLVVSCEHAEGSMRGVFVYELPSDPLTGHWIARDVSGPDGSKFDRMELLDIDGDGDLDVLTTEENGGEDSRGLGVIWYENPAVAAPRAGQERE